MRAALALLTVAALASAGRAQSQQGLVPANFNPQSDGAGYSWSLDSSGRVQVNNLGQLSELTVNGTRFYPNSRMMTADGAEWVFANQVNNQLQITRRARVSRKEAGMRVVDVVVNTSASPAPVSLLLHSRFNMTTSGLLSSSGSTLTGTLGKHDVGFLATTQQGTALLFCLAGSRSKLKPTVIQRHNYELSVTYTFTVKPGETAAVVHSLAQLPTLPAEKELARQFRPYLHPVWISDLPKELRRATINTRGAFVGGEAAGPLASLAEELGAEPGNLDLLAFGEGTAVRGTASCAAFRVRTRHGEAQLPLEQVAALAGGRHTGGVTLYLRDGQRLTGEVAADDLRFVMTTGLAVEPRVENLDRLVLRAPAEPASMPPGLLLVATHSGDRLLVKAADGRLQAATRWGLRPVAFDQLHALRPLSDDQPGSWVELVDRSRFRAFLGGEPLRLQSVLFGELELQPADVRAIDRPQTKAEEAEELLVPHVVLSGGDLIVGHIDLDALHIATGGEVIPVPPSQVRLLNNQLEGEAPEAGRGIPFVAEVWGGGSITGELVEVVLPVQAGGWRMQVPTRDLVSAAVPTPILPEAMRARMAQLIRELGDASWEAREAATRELAELGELARLQLEEARRTTRDPEVERRVRELLEQIER